MSEFAERNWTLSMNQPTAIRQSPHDPLLEIEALEVAFPGHKGFQNVVNRISLSINAGTTLGIIGESGSGKSMTARAIMGLLPSRARAMGSIRFEGRELLGLGERALSDVRGKMIALVPQDPARSLNPTIKVGKQIVEAIRLHEQVSKGEARARALDLLSRVRLPSPGQRFHEYPHQLSGGMRQRAVIAMALSCAPALLIADEATTALDVTTQAQVLNLLRELQEQYRMAMIFISHDIGIAAGHTDRVAVMYAGNIVEEADTDALFESVRMPYTKALLDAVPGYRRVNQIDSTTVIQAGEDSHSGCCFFGRCWRGDSTCERQVPRLERDVDDHRWACFHPLEVETGITQ